MVMKLKKKGIPIILVRLFLVTIGADIDVKGVVTMQIGGETVTKESNRRKKHDTLTNKQEARITQVLKDSLMSFLRMIHKYFGMIDKYCSSLTNLDDLFDIGEPLD